MILLIPAVFLFAAGFVLGAWIGCRQPVPPPLNVLSNTARLSHFETDPDPMMVPHVCRHGWQQLPGDTACRICDGECEEA